jgi:hypothetical protein
VTSTDRALEMLELLALTSGSPMTDVDLLLDRLDVARLPLAAVLLISTRACDFLDEVQRGFRRPVALVDVSCDDYRDFFEEKRQDSTPTGSSGKVV